MPKAFPFENGPFIGLPMYNGLINAVASAFQVSPNDVDNASVIKGMENKPTTHTSDPMLKPCHECGGDYWLDDVQTYDLHTIDVVFECNRCHRKMHMPFRPKGDSIVGQKWDTVSILYTRHVDQGESE